MQVKIGRKLTKVASYAQASAIWCAYRDESGLGSSRSPKVYVLEDDGTRRNVSYNGKVWPHASGRDWQVGDQPLYSPF